MFLFVRKPTGALKDATGDYTYSFYMAGATLFLAGFICFPLRRLNKCLLARRARNAPRESGADADNTTNLLEKNV